MNWAQKIDILSRWGEYLKKYIDEIGNTNPHNPWFTKENINCALQNICSVLTTEKLVEWGSPYVEIIESSDNKQNILVLSPGNIPLVGFHDFLSVIISGNKYTGKLSSNDNILLPKIVDFLIEIAPELKNDIHFTNNITCECDKIIATGSNNSARFFDYYFSEKPHIIRGNRNSCAILNGNETFDDLIKLGCDIFLYFGLGCRSVSKLFIPENYDFEMLFTALATFKNNLNLKDYYNNYIYQKALYTINNTDFIDKEFYLLADNASYASPISVVYFEKYKNVELVAKKIAADKNLLQCVVTKDNFGTAQHPQLNDYADSINTLEFLTRKY